MPTIKKVAKKVGKFIIDNKDKIIAVGKNIIDNIYGK